MNRSNGPPSSCQVGLEKRCAPSAKPWLCLQVGSALKSAAPNWQTKRERLTPRYTTCWEEMEIARM
ncbi:hypothetical protein B9Z38_16230 [Limnohabitans sp. MMS-10A-160]|uniref:DUF4113 domain-containing protein n=1 Tax=Limnohabitans sp. MMS-10A-160 TaxID=1835766 RepID=UPI000D3CFE33|nr:hypothetical protein B9Z38_16230 [Limnohabitans sp. MMS-10A-160]